VALQFRKERLDLFPLSLCVFKLRCGPEISCSLPSCLVHVVGKITERSAVVLWDLRWHGPHFLRVPSVVRHTEGHLFRTARARVTFSRMSVALAVQMKGLGF